MDDKNLTEPGLTAVSGRLSEIAHEIREQVKLLESIIDRLGGSIQPAPTEEVGCEAPGEWSLLASLQGTRDALGSTREELGGALNRLKELV